MVDFYSYQSLVLDIGSSSAKGGIAGEALPRVVIPSLIQRLPEENYSNQSKSINTDNPLKSPPMGMSLPATKPLNDKLGPHRPLSGTTYEFDLYQELVLYFYDQINPTQISEMPVLLTEPDLNPKRNREQITQMLFENLEVPALDIISQNLLALITTGRSDGIVINVTEHNLQISPIVDAYNLLYAISHVDLGDRGLTHFLIERLNAEGYRLEEDNFHHFEIARDIKEKMCQIALPEDHSDPNCPYPTHFDQIYELPDGNQIIISPKIKFCLTELIFSEKFSGAIKKSLSHLELNTNPVFLPSGGSTLFHGFMNRLQGEAIFEGSKIIEDDRYNREFLPWTGGSILASSLSFQQRWISLEEYEESGPSVIFRRGGF